MNYALTVFPAVEAGNPSRLFLFETRSELDAAKNTIADLLLFMQDRAKVMDDYSNMLLAEEKKDGDWEEISE